MRFPYTYKTSDGVRHSSEFEATSKDEVFAELRKIGIRPIKVFDPVRPSRWRVWKWFVAILPICIAAGMVAYFNRQSTGTSTVSPKYTPEELSAYTNLIGKAELLMARKDRFFSQLDLSRARNYALIEEVSDISKLETELYKARKHIGYVRAYMKDLFMGVYEIFPEESELAREDAKRTYGTFMERLDADELHIVQDTQAVRLLDANRGRWHTKDGQLVFDDPVFEQEFAPYRQPLDSSVSRWSKDFLEEATSSDYNGSLDAL